MATVFVAWPAFLTSSAFGVPRTSSQDVRKPASVNQWLKTGDASQRSYLACPQSVVNGCIKKKEDRHSGLSPWVSKDLVLRREPVLGEQMHGDFAEIPYDAEPGKNFQG